MTSNEKKPQDPITDTAASDPEEVGESKLVINKSTDPALLLTHGERVVYTAEEEASVLSKIDWHLLPLMCWVYALQFADKVSLNYASLMGIRTDTHLDTASQQYSWVSSIFYAGYIFSE
jgi:ACS family allantoate permease-like MFS transporter